MEDFTCSICLQPLSQPVRLRTGHVYDRHCITTWFRSRRPPYTCPLSGVVLDSPELLPAEDVIERAIACASELGDVEAVCALTRRDRLAAVVEEPLPPPPPPPLPPPPDASWATHAGLVACLVCGIQVLVVVVEAAMQNSLANFWRDSFPLHNHGSTYSQQPWLPFTSLFTNSGFYEMLFNTAFQFLFLRRALLVGLIPRGDVVAAVLSCSLLGAFAAGTAFPDDFLSSSGTVTSLSASAAVVFCELEGPRRFSPFQIFVIFVLSGAGGFLTHCELLSRLVGQVFFGLLVAAHSGSRRWAAAAAHVVLTVALVGVHLGGVSAPWLHLLKGRVGRKH